MSDRPPSALEIPSNKPNGTTRGNPPNYTFVFNHIPNSGRYRCQFQFGNYVKNPEQTQPNSGKILLVSTGRRVEVGSWRDLACTTICPEGNESLSPYYLFEIVFIVSSIDIKNKKVSLQFISEKGIGVIRGLDKMVMVAESFNVLREIAAPRWSEFRKFSPPIFKQLGIPEAQGLNILFLGPVGSGKSNMVNWLMSCLGREPLTEYTATRPAKGTVTLGRTDWNLQKYCPGCQATLVDVWGWETSNIQSRNYAQGQGQWIGPLFTNILEGFLTQEETHRNLEVASPIQLIKNAQNRWVNGVPPFSARIHVVVYVLDICNIESSDIEKFLDLSNQAAQYDLQPIVVLTKVDLFLDLNAANYYRTTERLYRCGVLHQRLVEIGEKLRINLTNIFPLMNHQTGDPRKESLETHLLGNAFECILNHGVAFCKKKLDQFSPSKNNNNNHIQYSSSSQDVLPPLSPLSLQETSTIESSPKKCQTYVQVPNSNLTICADCGQDIFHHITADQDTSCKIGCFRQCQRYVKIPNSDLTICAKCGHEWCAHTTECRFLNCKERCLMYVKIPNSDLTFCAKCGHERSLHGVDTLCRGEGVNEPCLKNCLRYSFIPNSDLTICAQCGHEKAAHGPPP